MNTRMQTTNWQVEIEWGGDGDAAPLPSAEVHRVESMVRAGADAFDDAALLKGWSARIAEATVWAFAPGVSVRVAVERREVGS